MRKKNVATTENFIVMVLLILGAAAYYILKWAFKLLCLITAAIVKAVGNAVKKHRRKKAEKDITDVPFVDTELNIEETSTAPAEVSREKLGLFDKRIYDGLFRPLIRERGEAYCSDGKIRDLRETGTHYCLEDWQKELVRNGSYDVWSFDEEKLEEDDYYFEDDE